MRRFAVFALLAACTSDRAEPPPRAPLTIPATAWLAKFDAATRFLPRGMTSFWFVDRRAVPDAVAGTLVTHLEIRCAGLFRVADHGSYGVPRERLARLGESPESLRDVPIWPPDAIAAGSHDDVTDPDRHLPGHWTACVDDRFLVRAATRDLLDDALERDGALHFAAVTPLPELDPATVDLVMRDDPPLTGIAALIANPVALCVWSPSSESVFAAVGRPWAGDDWVAERRRTGTLSATRLTPATTARDVEALQRRAASGLSIFAGEQAAK